MHVRLGHLWSARVQQAEIMHMPSDTLPRRAAYFLTVLPAAPPLGFHRQELCQLDPSHCCKRPQSCRVG
jgi:hypothetical protein